MPDYCINIRNNNELSIINKIQISEILVESDAFSFAGEINDEKLIQCFSELQQFGKKPVLVWDLLSKDDQLSQKKDLLDRIINRVVAIRFRDPGVGLFIKELYPSIPLQFSTEHCYQNNLGVIEWVETFKPMLSRIVFSNQVPLAAINSVRNKIDVEVELLGVGPLEIFYSGRDLLANLPLNEQNIQRKLETASLDRPEQISNVISNAKGTKIFYDKVLFTLEEAETLQASGINMLRLDLSSFSQFQLLADYYPDADWISLLKKSESKKTTIGFLNRNHTDNPFKKLTNQFLKKEIQNRIGLVLESVKNSYTLIRLIQPVKLPMVFNFFSPEGRVIKLKVCELKSLQGKKFEKVAPKGLYIHHWIKYTVPMSLIKTSGN